jgi:hypothetical protein
MTNAAGRVLSDRAASRRIGILTLLIGGSPGW